MDGGQSSYFIDDEYAPPRAHRNALAFGASIAAHVVAIALTVVLAPGIERPHSQWVMAYLVVLDSRPGGGGGGHAAAAGAPAMNPSPAPARRTIVRKPSHHVSHGRLAEPNGLDRRRDAPRARHHDDPENASFSRTASHETASVPLAAIAPAASGAAGIGGDGGTGMGAIGDGAGAGTASARVKYGENPAPLYPAKARRRAEQGTVALRILVAADGAVKRIEVASSSGFDALDDAAVETVRERWRFVPAIRDGVAVESWVEVPIRFALTEANTN